MEIKKGVWYLVDRNHRYCFPGQAVGEKMRTRELVMPIDDTAVRALQFEAEQGNVLGPVEPPAMGAN